MQCSMTIYISLLALPACHEQLAINVLWTTDCNIVCSLETESHASGALTVPPFLLAQNLQK